MIVVEIFRGDAGDDELLAFTVLVENLILLLQTDDKNTEDVGIDELKYALEVSMMILRVVRTNLQ